MQNKTEREDFLVQLNDKLARTILERIQAEDATAQDFNVARQFLKDRNIDDILRGYEAPEKDNPVLQLAQQFKQELDEFDRQAEAG